MLDITSHNAICAKLDELIASEPSERKSKLAITLDPFREQITKALAKGHSFRSIAGALRYGGITVSPETVRRYVQRINGNKTKRATRRTSTRATASSTPSATVSDTPTVIEQPQTPLGSTLTSVYARRDMRI